ncbi:hypothetical protein [Oribacterium sp. C9]|uniref:hypothetical protein n=1 Tax=Oribacterium sp. C9 TaxID=1943579 RepID=UPI00111555C9|nr:hypothetical protein [Oribacterium sp. C9]
MLEIKFFYEIGACHCELQAVNISMPENSYEQNLMLKLLNYIESEYKNAALSDFIEKNSYFHRIFRENFGMSPREYRLKYLASSQ